MIPLWNWECRVARQGFIYIYIYIYIYILFIFFFFFFFVALYSYTVTDWNCKAVFVLARRRNAPAQRVYQGEKILTANSCTLVVLLLFTLVWYRQQSPSNNCKPEAILTAALLFSVGQNIQLIVFTCLAYFTKVLVADESNSVGTRWEENGCSLGEVQKTRRGL